LSLLAHSAPAQLIGLGFIGGARVSTETFGNIHTESNREVVGPRVDVHVSKNFFVEVDGLFRPVGFTAYQQSLVTNEVVRERSTSWEIPMMLKYRYTGYKVRPFFGVGYDPRWVSGTDVSNGAFVSGARNGITTYTYLINQTVKTAYPVSNGLVASGGMEFVVGPLRISPELRYMHWSPSFLNFNQNGALGGFKYNSDHNELLGLVGVTWH
jgi:hypothetical protein